jgi:hypothetical protein
MVANPDNKPTAVRVPLSLICAKYCAHSNLKDLISFGMLSCRVADIFLNQFKWLHRLVNYQFPSHGGLQRLYRVCPGGYCNVAFPGFRLTHGVLCAWRTRCESGSWWCVARSWNLNTRIRHDHLRILDSSAVRTACYISGLHHLVPSSPLFQ